MTKSELIEAMARASYERVASVYGGPWDSLRQIDRESLILDMEAALSAIEQAGLVVVHAKPLEPLSHYVKSRQAMPLRGIGDSFHTIHVGSEHEAELRFSDLEAIEAGRIK